MTATDPRVVAVSASTDLSSASPRRGVGALVVAIRAGQRKSHRKKTSRLMLTARRDHEMLGFAMAVSEKDAIKSAVQLPS